MRTLAAVPEVLLHSVVSKEIAGAQNDGDTTSVSTEQGVDEILEVLSQPGETIVLPPPVIPASGSLAKHSSMTVPQQLQVAVEAPAASAADKAAKTKSTAQGVIQPPKEELESSVFEADASKRALQRRESSISSIEIASPAPEEKAKGQKPVFSPISSDATSAAKQLTGRQDSAVTAVTATTAAPLKETAKRQDSAAPSAAATTPSPSKETAKRQVLSSAPVLPEKPGLPRERPARRTASSQQGAAPDVSSNKPEKAGTSRVAPERARKVTAKPKLSLVTQAREGDVRGDTTATNFTYNPELADRAVRAKNLLTDRRFLKMAKTLMRFSLEFAADKVLKSKNQNEIELRKRGARRLREALVDLGPTFIKLGQFLSVRRDCLSVEMADELAVLQDKVPPFPFELARKSITSELGAPPEQIFRIH